MLENMLNYALFRSVRANRVQKQFLNCIESELAEGFTELLLRLMSLVLFLNMDFRRNIKNFRGRYLFRSRDDEITVAAVFRDNRLRVYDKAIANTDVTVTFKDARALMNYILSPKPDILGSILRQDVVIDGNFNYLYKFAYMAKHLQLMATGKA
ncbi:MAG: hypothetical protein BA868_04300 [Desulfobacterales bacterium C00003106]|jgi:hypothetical protein|nr:MAG: hypothetical protein BA868_04300 [Desulfobacterales bacterium C00003106]